MKTLWSYHAGIYNGLPLDDRSALEILNTPRPEPGEPRNRYVYYADTAEVPEVVAVNVRRRSFTIAAAVVIDTADAQGALFSQGAIAGGHTLYVQDGRLHYVYNWLGERIQKVSADRDISTGRHVLTAEFQKTGDDAQTMSAIGTLTLYVDDAQVGHGGDLDPARSVRTGRHWCLASGATAARPSRPTTRRRSASRVGPSIGSSSTSAVTPTSTTRRKCSPGSLATDHQRTVTSVGDLVELTAVEQRRLIGTKAVSARELLDAHLARVEAVNPATNAIVALDPDVGRASRVGCRRCHRQGRGPRSVGRSRDGAQGSRGDGGLPDVVRLALVRGRSPASGGRSDRGPDEGGRSGGDRQDQHSRVRCRVAHVQRGLRGDSQPVGARAQRRWVERRRRSCARLPDGGDGRRE